jgi:hypothetical protein
MIVILQLSDLNIQMVYMIVILQLSDLNVQIVNVQLTDLNVKNGDFNIQIIINPSWAPSPASCLFEEMCSYFLKCLERNLNIQSCRNEYVLEDRGWIYVEFLRYR